jgi:hypothetical protein
MLQQGLPLQKVMIPVTTIMLKQWTPRFKNIVYIRDSMFYHVHYVNFIIMLVCTNKTVLQILAVTCWFKKVIFNIHTARPILFWLHAIYYSVTIQYFIATTLSVYTWWFIASTVCCHGVTENTLVSAAASTLYSFL